MEAALVNAAQAVGPPLLFGLRLWASVCLALFVAFWLQYDGPELGRPVRGDRVSTRGFAAQGRVPHDRYRGRRPVRRIGSLFWGY